MKRTPEELAQMHRDAHIRRKTSRYEDLVFNRNRFNKGELGLHKDKKNPAATQLLICVPRQTRSVSKKSVYVTDDTIEFVIPQDYVELASIAHGLLIRLDPVMLSAYPEQYHSLLRKRFKKYAFLNENEFLALSPDECTEAKHVLSLVGVKAVRNFDVGTPVTQYAGWVLSKRASDQFKHISRDRSTHFRSSSKAFLVLDGIRVGLQSPNLPRPGWLSLSNGLKVWSFKLDGLATKTLNLITKLRMSILCQSGSPTGSITNQLQTL
jgi:hypothetical protein